MGLSDEERYSKMTFACHNLYQLKKEFKNQYPYEHLYQLLNDVWPTLLKPHNNNMLWLLGTDFDDPQPISEKSVWTVALGNKLDILNRKIEGNSCLDDIHLITDHLNMKDFILYSNAYDNQMLSKVADVYEWTESAFYALRRYRDEFESNFEDLAKILSNIQGECFKHFNDNEVFTNAFLARGCVLGLLNSNLNIKEKCEKMNWHHTLNTAARLNEKDLLYYHKLINSNNSNNSNEITPDQTFQILAVFLMGSITKYQENDFIKFAKNNGVKKIAQLKFILEQTRKARTDRNNFNSDDYTQIKNSRSLFFVHRSSWNQKDQEYRIPDIMKKAQSISKKSSKKSKKNNKKKTTTKKK